MNKGCLIFAHNSEIDYGSQAVLAASLASKHLKVPVSLVTDSETLLDIKLRFKKLPFDQIIEVEKPVTSNSRSLAVNKVTDDREYENVSFINSNRYSAYNLSPYERTLLIDTDFLIFSDALGQFWDSHYSFLISPGMVELQSLTTSPKGYLINQTSIKMLWATTIMFSKNAETKMLFDLVEYIEREYYYFSRLYEFDPGQYRNDYAFSIACHIMSGFSSDCWQGELPTPLLFRDSDEIITVHNTGQINMLLQTPGLQYLVAKCQGQDVHMMNKRNIISNLESLLKLADYE